MTGPATAPAPRPPAEPMDEVGVIRARLRQVGHDLDHVVRERNRMAQRVAVLEARLSAVAQLAERFDGGVAFGPLPDCHPPAVAAAIREALRGGS